METTIAYQITQKQEKSPTDKIQILRELAHQYQKEENKYNERFLTLKTAGLKSLLKLKKGELGVLLYLLSNINRDIGYTEKEGEIIKHKVWGNLHFYYQDGYLATIRTQTRIAKDTEYDQRNVSRWLSSLIEKEYIKIIGYENIKVGNSVIKSPVYAMGILVDTGGNKREMFYYEGMLK